MNCKIGRTLRVLAALAAIGGMPWNGAGLAWAQEWDATIGVRLSDLDVSSRLMALPDQGTALVDGVSGRAGRSSPSRLRLQRFQVFAPDAVVVVSDGVSEQHIAPPAMAHFRGHVEGDPESAVFLSVAEDGRIRAIIHQNDNIDIVERANPSAGRATGTVTRQVQPQLDFASRTFSCGAETDSSPSQTRLPLVGRLTAPRSTTEYTARIAVDTDFEFYQLFGSTSAATQYVADLLAYASTVYVSELQTRLQVGNVYIYSNSNDPWSATSTSAALDEVGNYWRANRTGVSRTTTHFISGKRTGGGIAWLDVLCNDSYGYGVSMGMDGNFSAANPQIVWDATSVAHELGHNFGSGHTHDYANTGGNANPVDCCSMGSGCSVQSLPGLGSLTGGTAGARNGTLMSYCQLLSPGMSNLAYTLGRNHPYGIAASRVPTLMRQSVEAAVATYPSCFATTSVSGQCGAANGVPTTATPVNGLCLSGSASAVATNAGTYSWTCQGSGGGGSASCQAPRAFTVTATTTGIGGTIAPASQVVQYGATTTFTLQPQSGYAGTASGCAGALSGNTYITGTITSACTVTASFNSVAPTTFLDISGSWAYDYINAIRNAGITTGCGSGNYCPSSYVTREQMAAFLVRAKEGEPAAGYCGLSNPFNDVPYGSPMCRYIKRLAELAITTGCGAGSYCPTGLVTREHMAAFVVRAKEGDPPANYCGNVEPFGDVPVSNAYCGHIKRLSELGVVTGCGAGNYCPSGLVTREQMAAFLARAFLGMN